MKKLDCKKCHYLINGLACDYENKTCIDGMYKNSKLENESDESLVRAKSNKKIKTTDMNFKIRTTKHLVVEINSFRFVLDEEMPWITIQDCINGEVYEDIDEIDEDFVIEIHTLEDLKVVAMNWYFNNVEVVKKI